MLQGLGPHAHRAASTSASAVSVLEVKIRCWLRCSADDSQVAQHASCSSQLDFGAVAIGASQLRADRRDILSHAYQALSRMWSFVAGLLRPVP